MADDKTQTLGGGGPDLEARIMARFDSLDARLSALEKIVEDRLREMRPIWERALAEIMATQADVRALHSKLDVLGEDVLEVRAKQRQADIRLKELEDFVKRA